MRACDLFVQEPLKEYRASINPPYKKRDFITIIGTLILILIIPLTVVFATQVREPRIRASERVNEIDTIESDSLNLFKLNSSSKKLSQSKKADSISEMRILARNRKGNLKKLLEKDPKSVLKVVYPPEIYESFSPEIQVYLEKPIKVSGELQILAIDDMENKKSRTEFYLMSDKERYKLYPIGKIKARKSGERIEVSGYQIDKDIVFKTSEKEKTKVLAEETLGEQKTVVILTNFLNKTTVAPTLLAANNTVFASATSINSYYQEVSYNQTSLSGDVFGRYIMNLNQTCDIYDIADAAVAVADPYVTFTNYSRIIVAYPNTSCGWAGVGSIGKWTVTTLDGTQSASIAWIDSAYFTTFTVGHEFGHNLGVWHANALDCGSEMVSETCDEYEYGDRIDIMGGYNTGHMNASFKQELNWFSPSNVVTAMADGNYTIEPIETASSGVKAIKVFLNEDWWYWLEFRQAIGKDAIFGGYPNLLNGILVHASPADIVQDYDSPSELLDGTPENYYYLDPALEVGRTFTDPFSNNVIQVLSKTSNSITVNIDVGILPCVQANPTVSIDPSTVWKAKGQTATFTVTVTNNDNSGCSTANFSLIKNIPSGWSGNFSPSTLSIAPGASATSTFTVTSLASAVDGYYDLSITAANGGYFDSETATYVVVTDSTPPTVSITAPTVGATVSGTINITADATDNIRVGLVQFYVDNVLKYTDIASPWSYPNWDTTIYSNGSHTLTAKAYDVLSNMGTSTPVIVTVSNGGTPPSPTANIKVNNLDGPITINYNESATLSWTSTNATDCTGSSGWSGSKGISGSESTGNLTSSKTYTLTCTNAGGSVVDSVVVNVNPPPAPTVDIKANSSNGPVTVVYNTVATLSWTTTNATSCTASNGWSGSKVTSGSESTGRLNTSKTYTITCTGVGGSATDSVTVSVGKIGDLNLDNSINIRDASILVSRWNSADQTADINGDGGVNIRDASLLVSRWGT